VTEKRQANSEKNEAVPLWMYELPPVLTALVMVLFVETISLTGLILARRFVVPRFDNRGDINEAVSGTVQAIGVFYGITVGLIASGVWSTNSAAAQLTSNEAISIAVLYREVSGYPQPPRAELQAKLREYTVFVIEEAWPAQRKGQGQSLTAGVQIVEDFESRLYTFEPSTPGQAALYSQTLKAYNHLLEARRLRIDAVESGLSPVMWAVIWMGAIISIGVAYFYKIEDLKLHAILVSLMAGFLAIVLFMIIVNDKPFYGRAGIPPDAYKLVLKRIDMRE
jgi:hypothetical protein